MNKKTILLFFVLIKICAPFSLNAQHDLTTSFIPEIWASSFTNPAWVPEGKIHVGLPSFYYNNKGFSNDLRNFIDFSGNNPLFDLGKFANEINSDFQFQAQQIIHPIYFSIKLNNFRVGLEYSLQNNSVVTVPADLFRFSAFGNSPYVGQTLNLGPKIYSVASQSLSIPISFESNKWTFGIRPALVNGIFSIETKRSDLELYTNPEYYQLSLNGDFLIQSSGVLSSNPNSIIGAELLDNVIANGLSWKGNSGINLDLGVRYRHNDKLSLGLSLVGIGQITWNQNVQAFSSNGIAAFKGIDLNGIIDGDSINIENVVDDVVESFQLNQEEIADFKTETAKKVYLNARYQINEFVETGGIFYGEFFNGKIEPAFALNFRVKTGNLLSIGVTYGAHYNQWNHVGVNFLLELGPVQIFAGTNNLINISNLVGRESTNLRVGLSAAFGEKKNVE